MQYELCQYIKHYISVLKIPVLSSWFILPVSCVYIMETVYYIKVNNNGLKQNLAIHDYETRRSDISKKSVINLGTKLHNKLPDYLKNTEN